MVLGCSPDSIESHRKFSKKRSLEISLLSDPSKETMTAYGGYGPKSILGVKTKGVIRSTVLIDPEGRVAEVWRPVHAKGHADLVLAKLQTLNSSP